MAASRCSRTPLVLTKRIKLFHIGQPQPSNPVNSYLHTTAKHPRAQPVDEPSRLVSTYNTPNPPSPSTSLTSDQSQPSTEERISNHPLRPQDAIKTDLLSIATARGIPIPPVLDPTATSAISRLPRALQALYLNPLRRKPTHNILAANLQLRSYSVRNLELMADFAMRAAYFLNLPAKGPVPLPRITERWTVPRSNFIFKKSQENWERVTCRRLVQVVDGEPEVVRRWLGFLRRSCWYGVGMKADVFEWEGIDVAAKMDQLAEEAGALEESVEWDFVGRRKGMVGKEAVAEYLDGKGFGSKQADGLIQPSGTSANKKSTKIPPAAKTRKATKTAN